MTTDQKIALVNPFTHINNAKRAVKKHKEKIVVGAALAGSLAVNVLAIKKLHDAEMFNG